MSKKAIRPSKKDRSPRNQQDLKSRGSIASEGELSDAELQPVVGGVVLGTNFSPVNLTGKSQDSLSDDAAATYEQSKALFQHALKVVTEYEERKTQVIQRLG